MKTLANRPLLAAFERVHDGEADALRGLHRMTIRQMGIAFPKTQTAACLLTDAPGAVSSRQLRELNIRLREQTGPGQAG